jgi:hypothetical protein
MILGGPAQPRYDSQVVDGGPVQNPGASDRRIAELTGFDHKTVARYRAGEFPAISPEIPDDGGEFPGVAPD